MKAGDIEEFKELLDDAERWAFVEWDMNFVAYMRDRYMEDKENTFIRYIEKQELERIANGK